MTYMTNIVTLTMIMITTETRNIMQREKKIGNTKTKIMAMKMNRA